jgi:hypothetical protein
VTTETKRRIARMVVQDRCLIAGNFSEPVTTALIGGGAEPVSDPDSLLPNLADSGVKYLSDIL